MRRVLVFWLKRPWADEPGGEMPARRRDVDRLRELVRLHRLGSGGREVARLLELSPKTAKGGGLRLSITRHPGLTGAALLGGLSQGCPKGVPGGLL